MLNLGKGQFFTFLLHNVPSPLHPLLLQTTVLPNLFPMTEVHQLYTNVSPDIFMLGKSSPEIILNIHLEVLLCKTLLAAWVKWKMELYKSQALRDQLLFL